IHCARREGSILLDLLLSAPSRLASSGALTLSLEHQSFHQLFQEDRCPILRYAISQKSALPHPSHTSLSLAHPNTPAAPAPIPCNLRASPSPAAPSLLIHVCQLLLRCSCCPPR